MYGVLLIFVSNIIDSYRMNTQFLFWYYRSINVPEIILHPQQADHIRYWADYPMTRDLKWDYYNIKFDYMYSAALLQKLCMVNEISINFHSFRCTTDQFRRWGSFIHGFAVRCQEQLQRMQQYLNQIDI